MPAKRAEGGHSPERPSPAQVPARNGAHEHQHTYDQQDRLITLDTTTYQHSPDGERTKKHAITYTHNAEGHLEKVVNGATTIDYVLDPFGRRIARKKNGTVTHRFLWGSALGPHRQCQPRLRAVIP